MPSLLNYQFEQGLKSKINFILDYFLPRLCASCKKNLSTQELIICKECFSELKTPETSYLKNEFERKFSNDNLIDDFKAAFLFQQDKPIQHLIHSLKYENKFLVGIYMGKLISNIFFEDIKLWNIDLIVPIPLHRLKKLDRGYNQSEFIAKGISKSLNIPYARNIVRRIKYTETQTHLNIDERKENVSNAFKVVNPKKISGKNIILVDDVITTGSTVCECARTLRNAGVQKIFALFLAIA